MTEPISHSVTRRPSASRLYRAASGIPPEGTPLTRACRCVMCGSDLVEGDLHLEITPEIIKKRFGDSFNNQLDMKVPLKGNVICGDCAVMREQVFMQTWSKSYVTEKGLFKLASNEDVQAFLLNPPEPPIVAIFSTRKQQHMVWRTPVSWSNQALFLRVNDEILTIRRAAAIAGTRAYRLAVERMKALGMKGLPAYFERDLLLPSMGMLRTDLANAMRAEGDASAHAVSILENLGMGEWWAIGHLRHVNLDDPASWPKPVQLPAAQEALV